MSGATVFPVERVEVELPASSLDRRTQQWLERIRRLSLEECRRQLRRRDLSRQVRAALWRRARDLETGVEE